MTQSHSPIDNTNAHTGRHGKGLGAMARWLESPLFDHRAWVLSLFAMLSVLLAWSASGLRAGASFEKMIPKHHPSIVNYLSYESELRTLGNVVRIAVATQRGDIYTKEYLD